MFITLGAVLAFVAQSALLQLGTMPLDGPPPGAVAWFKPGQGVEVGLSSLASHWGDSSNHGNHVSQTDGARQPRWARALLNGHIAMQFDGNDFLDAPSAMPLGSYTKVVFLEIESASGTGGEVFSGVSGHSLSIGANGVVKLSHAGSVFTSGVAPQIATGPVVICATYDASSNRGRLYVDTEFIATGEAATDNFDPSIRLGSPVTVDSFFGAIGEALLYDRVLDVREIYEIQRHMQRTYLRNSAPVVDFLELPKDGQLFPRSGAAAIFHVSGTVSTAGYDSIEAILEVDGMRVAQASSVLAPDLGGGDPSFDLQLPITAGLFDHSLRVSLVSGRKRTLVAERINLVAGDVYIVHGQSNAAGLDVYQEGLAAGDEGRWIRSFGLAGRTDDVPFDLHWDVADALSHPAHVGIGAVGVRLGRRLVEQLQVPVAIFNGAEGATFIAQHQPNPTDHSDLTTLYGRLYARLSQAGVAQHARAMVWYQGESDAADPLGYELAFGLLRGAWFQDYPGLERVYVLQVRQGCGFTDEGVRGVQRALPAQYPDVSIMSTTAVPTHDGCHYFHSGYAEIGERIARVIARDLHFAPVIDNIDPPDVKLALLEAPDQIRLVLANPEDTYILENGAEAFFVTDDAGVTVVSGVVQQETILLQLSGRTTATYISYVGHAGDGPWLRNALGVGALTFFEQPLLR